MTTNQPPPSQPLPGPPGFWDFIREFEHMSVDEHGHGHGHGHGPGFEPWARGPGPWAPGWKGKGRCRGEGVWDFLGARGDGPWEWSQGPSGANNAPPPPPPPPPGAAHQHEAPGAPMEEHGHGHEHEHEHEHHGRGMHFRGRGGHGGVHGHHHHHHHHHPHHQHPFLHGRRRGGFEGRGGPGGSRGRFAGPRGRGMHGFGPHGHGTGPFGPGHQHRRSWLSPALLRRYAEYIEKRQREVPIRGGQEQEEEEDDDDDDDEETLFNQEDMGANAPAVNMRASSTHVHVDIAVPGVKTDDVHVAFEDLRGILTVSGGYSQGNTDNDEGEVVMSEHGTGRFARDIVVPYAVAGEGLVANLDAGVLSVRLPRADAAEGAEPGSKSRS